METLETLIETVKHAEAQYAFYSLCITRAGKEGYNLVSWEGVRERAAEQWSSALQALNRYAEENPEVEIPAIPLLHPFMM